MTDYMNQYKPDFDRTYIGKTAGPHETSRRQIINSRKTPLFNTLPGHVLRDFFR